MEHPMFTLINNSPESYTSQNEISCFRYNLNRTEIRRNRFNRVVETNFNFVFNFQNFYFYIDSQTKQKFFRNIFLIFQEIIGKNTTENIFRISSLWVNTSFFQLGKHVLATTFVL